MEKIMKAINCPECKQILETPVFLPCQHSICQRHVTEKKSGDILKCAKCGIEHEIPKSGFPVMEALCEIIEAQIGSIDFGYVHKEASESCDRLARFIQDMDYLLKDPTAYTYDEISNLKNRVHRKSEQLKLKIDEETEKLLNKLNEYKNLCDNSLTTESYLNEKIKYELSKNDFLTRLSSWKSQLADMKVDENKWRQITQSSNEKIRELEDSIKSYKENLLLKEFNNYNSHVDFFEQVNTEPLFWYNIPNKTDTNQSTESTNISEEQTNQNV